MTNDAVANRQNIVRELDLELSRQDLWTAVFNVAFGFSIVNFLVIVLGDPIWWLNLPAAVLLLIGKTLIYSVLQCTKARITYLRQQL